MVRLLFYLYSQLLLQERVLNVEEKMQFELAVTEVEILSKKPKGVTLKIMDELVDHVCEGGCSHNERKLFFIILLVLLNYRVRANGKFNSAGGLLQVIICSVNCLILIPSFNWTF